MLKEKSVATNKPSGLRIKTVYWNWVEKFDRPDWQSEFISVHYNKEFNKERPFSICSPLFLVDDKGNRPMFEKLRFKTRGSAVIAALALAELADTFVVDCTIGDTVYDTVIQHKFKLGKEGM